MSEPLKGDPSEWKQIYQTTVCAEPVPQKEEGQHVARPWRRLRDRSGARVRTHRRDGLADSATPARILANDLGLCYCMVSVMASWIHACMIRAHRTFVHVIPKRAHRQCAAHRQTDGRCDQRGYLRCSPPDQCLAEVARHGSWTLPLRRIRHVSKSRMTRVRCSILPVCDLYPVSPGHKSCFAKLSFAILLAILLGTFSPCTCLLIMI